MTVGQLELGDHHRLRIVFGPNDLDNPVEVQESDQKAIEQLGSIVDPADADLAAPDQHLDMESQPCRQRLPQAHHAGRPRGIEHVEVEREANFEVGQSLQEQIVIHGAGARLEDQPHRFVAFVPDVGEDRQLLVGDELGDLLDQLGLLHTIGDFAHKQVPAAALLALDLDLRAKAE